MNLGTRIWETLGQHRKMKINRETSRELAGYFVGVEISDSYIEVFKG